MRWTSVLSWMVFAALGGGLSGCDQLGVETPAKAAERQLAEAKAIGGACRHALRAIEDCYTLNPKADKSSVFTGWREMDEYMRENKMDGIEPVVPRPAAGGKPKAKPRASDDEEGDEVVEEPTFSRGPAGKPTAQASDPREGVASAASAPLEGAAATSGQAERKKASMRTPLNAGSAASAR